MLRRTAILALIAVAAALAAAPAAHADADPASDFLVIQDVYWPYAPGVSNKVAARLATQVKAIRDDDYKLKVALIARPIDLGAVSDLYGKPQRYAPFLASELGYLKDDPLLVVMPSGFGYTNFSADARRAMAGLDRPGTDPDGMAEAAMRAVRRIGQATGHPVEIPKVGDPSLIMNQAGAPAHSGSGAATAPADSGESGFNPWSIVVAVGPVLLVGIAIAALAVRNRRRGEPV
jgi:hypothetical protein